MHKAVREEGLLLRTRRRRGRRFCMGRFGESSPDLPARDFEAEDPMAKPATNVAEFRVGGAKPRLSPVVDPCSDEVVAYSISGPPNMKTAQGCRRASRAGSMAKTPRCRIRTWAGSTGCPPIGSRSSGRGSPGPCPAKEAASTTRRPRTSSRWPRPSFATIGRDGPDVFERDPGKHVDRYGNARIKRRLDGSGPVECRLSRAA